MTDPEDAPEDCWFCADPRTDPPPGGWLYTDEHWRVGHLPPTFCVAGATMVEAVRHVPDESAMSDEELATLGGVVGRTIAAMREATGCDRVYRWATNARFAHFHLWLIPWWATASTHGPRYLLEVTEGGGADPGVAASTAARLREALSADPERVRRAPRRGRSARGR